MLATKISSPAYLLKGFTLLKHPRVRLFVIAPMLVNLMLFATITSWAFSEFNQTLTWLLTKIPDYLDFLVWLIWPMFMILLLLIYGYTFAIIGNLIASPLYGLLAERVAEVVSGTSDDTPMTFKHALDIAKRALTRELYKLWYFLPRLTAVVILTAILAIIPALSVLAPVITFFWGAWSLSLQYLDYPADNSEVSFKELLKILREARGTAIGFGGTTLIVTSIPIVNLFAAPAAVAGASALWVENLGLIHRSGHPVSGDSA